MADDFEDYVLDAVPMASVFDAAEVYRRSNGELTKQFYAELEKRGAIGIVAVNLFRAHKCSTRAKRYRGGRGGQSFRGMAYDRKQWSLNNLCSALLDHAERLGLRWGWKEDPLTPGYRWVLYVDLPCGQVSFHGPTRGAGPDYPAKWDRQAKSAERIIEWCDRILATP